MYAYSLLSLQSIIAHFHVLIFCHDSRKYNSLILSILSIFCQLKFIQNKLCMPLVVYVIAAQTRAEHYGLPSKHKTGLSVVVRGTRGNDI